MMITCRTCGDSHPNDHFSRDSKAKHRRDRRCRKCLALQQRKRQRTNRGRFTTARYMAGKRGIAWNLTFEQFDALRNKPCHYCGHPLPDTGFGLDRLDPCGDYSPGNVVPCCTECNLAKGNMFSAEEMVRFIGPAIAAAKTHRASQAQPYQPGRGWGRPRTYSAA